ncbi:MAG: alkaline phosphatase D family protein [bacterium]
MMKVQISKMILTSLILFLSPHENTFSQKVFFRSTLPGNTHRTWIGSEYWANPLQDWQIKNSRIECISSGGERNVFLLTHELNNKRSPFQMSVQVGRMENDSTKLDDGWIGFSIGVRGEFNDYRDDAVRGVGFPIGITTRGQLFIGQPDSIVQQFSIPLQNIWLVLTSTPKGSQYEVSLSAYKIGGVLLSSLTAQVPEDWLKGGIALVCHKGRIPRSSRHREPFDYPNWGTKPGTERSGNVRFWFKNWEMSGSKLSEFPDRSFGPILFSHYTLSKGILKLTAQLPPIGKSDGQSVQLFLQQSKGSWTQTAEAPIDTDSYTATLRIERWDGTRGIPYRLVYAFDTGLEQLQQHTFEGVIRKEPNQKKEIVIAAFTGNNDLGFPNNDIVKQVKSKKPDLLFFSGDQIYEGVGGYGVEVGVIEWSMIDYLRKWYLYGWAYRDLLRSIPSVALPDDHDVYHGNVWGAGGKATPAGLSGADAQDQGGYKMPARWVNMIQRTQTAHLPDPYDAAPVEQGIGVYYCNLQYAGISFAVLEDRKFKSAPKPLLPTADIWNGFIRYPAFDPKTESDVPTASLLGERQEKFLNAWSSDWRDKTWMKVVLSQTIFSCVQTLPEGSTSDQSVPQLRILQPGEYPENDVPVADLDSDGWPQSGRNRALREMRKGFAFHIAGDQHLGTVTQYGIDDWRDAGYAFCVPAISNVWPRRWFPRTPGLNREPNSPLYNGDFIEGLGNKVTMYASSNPYFTGLNPSNLYDRATGFAIIRFNRETRSITMECWQRSPQLPGGTERQYSDWPITINQLDNYGRKAVGSLPTVKVKGISDPVIQVIDESDGEIVYTLRIKGKTITPKIFSKGSYTISIGEQGTTQWKTFKKIKPVPAGSPQVLNVKF